MVGIQGTTLDSATKEFLAQIRPNGVILFSRNIESPQQISKLNDDLQKYASSIELDPLFIAVDQEGGRVRRLKEPFSAFPPSWEMAHSATPDKNVIHFARQTAQELRSAGFNLDFVPVLDMVDEKVDLKSTVIGDRSFGNDPAVVARLGTIVIEEMRSKGIIPCAKHFPGHGATIVDSHLDLPIDKRNIQELDIRDLVPFRRATQIGVEMMMTAHVLFPSIDELFPATMSQRILKTLLRDQIGYQGIIITDDLDMGAVTKTYSTQTCVIESIRAGADILLICNSQDKAIEALSTLRMAYESKEFDPIQISASLERIASVKKRFQHSLLAPAFLT